MKSEYINLFTVTANPVTNEVVISLKQEMPDSQIEVDENGAQTINTKIEFIDMYKAVLSLSSAKNLTESLQKCIEEVEKLQGNPENE